ncbi:TonB-dependent outer membrane receptor, SusC/RagA subfamily, signature region [Robiginitalea myxolifaciens]|uniref:TonB-dependent outer membrane receptor, SusC/RagA subfamily, signature region n=1 Tax=Robiginitalea myxolifaciens TaxID=400055 RepID=A0A1I6HK22_9FLAO|nr:carboxypeptidase-like regulatory domain-containing protein [Robiginitalea myxolifaciens]SFR54812.1 TonB-dependent outer membrane receptor, SusC/RagA subfamily, signature region [Robiginitalea myxolifaciens]
MTRVLLLAVVFLFSTISIQGQDFNALWERVDSLELEGKFKSAASLVDSIAEVIQQKRLSNQDPSISPELSGNHLKSFLFRSKFILHLEENAQETVFRELEEAIAQAEFPERNILYSIQAGILQQYLLENLYQVRNRTALSDTISNADFKQWDATTLVLQIGKSYQKSLSKSDSLKQIDIALYSQLLADKQADLDTRPTLFDVLAHRALDFFKVDRWYVDRPAERFFMKSPELFDSEGGFGALEFNTPDSLFSEIPALKIMQELEAFHKEKDTLAYVYVLNERLGYVRDNSTLDNRAELYQASLESAWKRLQKSEVASFLGFRLAEDLFRISEGYNAKMQASLAGHRVRAHQICTDIIEQYPNSDGGLRATLLKNKIEQLHVSIEMESQVLPNKPFLTRVEYKNLDSLHLFVFRGGIPTRNTTPLSNDSLLLEYIQSGSVSIVKSYKVQKRTDYYSYSTELGLPPLPIGNYIVIAGKRDKLVNLADVLAYQELRVTRLSLLSTLREKELELRVLDRETGVAVEGAKIAILNKGETLKAGRTDKQGRYVVRRKRKGYRPDILIALEGDSLLHSNKNLPVRNGRYDEDEEHRAKGYVFLDRAIYRPGQELFFKGLLIETRKRKTRVVPKTWVTIVIYDSNNQELKEFRLKTNDYGSVHGSYKLPRTIATGEFSIELDEDFNEDGDDDPYWYKVDDFDWAETEFSVEEYKRPRFEVQMDSITADVLLGDDILVSGQAKAFLGAGIDGALVKYSVTRLPNFYHMQTPTAIVAEGETTTNREGIFELSFRALPDSSLVPKDRGVYSFKVLAEVTDINGETRTGEIFVQAGDHNLNAELLLKPTWRKGQTQGFAVQARNLNGGKAKANASIKIHKLREPKYVLRKKPWQTVEVHTLNREEYRSAFPYEPYDSLDLKENWPVDQIVYTADLVIDGEATVDIPEILDWETGTYRIELMASDSRQDTVNLKRQFDLFDPNGSTVTMDTRFDYNLLNVDFKEDGFILMEFASPARALTFHLDAYYEKKLVFNYSGTLNDSKQQVGIPVSPEYKDRIEFNLYYVWNNMVFQDQVTVNFPEAPKKLNIETLSFRDKLVPGTPESWSFRITDSNGAAANAEVLASLYDSSLDQFKANSWPTDLNTSYYYDNNSAPRVDTYGSFNTSYFRIFNRDRRRFKFPPLPVFPEIGWFGLNFGKGTYETSGYLHKLRREKLRAQPRKEGNISGIVTDQMGLPLPGVNVIVQGTTLGTQTDFDGFYTLNAPRGSVLIFSYLGFSSTSISVKKSQAVNVSLSEDAQALDEVVVTAYGIQRRKNALGYTVVYDEAEEVVNDIDRQLTGTVSGVTISATSGAPGAASNVVIRGMNSVSVNDRTLIIVDGVPMTQLQYEILLKPGDISDINVLKGSSAATLYGERGANGVIVITTKQGARALENVGPRSDLRETAIFMPQLRTDASGEVRLEFNAPEALTRWRLMLLAHTRKLDVGALEHKAVTRKDISVVPNYPRFLRSGDTLVYSAKVSNLTELPQQGTAQLTLMNGLTLEDVTGQVLNANVSSNLRQQSFTLDPGASQNLEWELVVPEYLEILEIKTVATTGQKSDGELKVIPVLSNRLMITESKPFWIQPGKKTTLAFPQLEQNGKPSLESLGFRLEYTSNPAWMAVKALPYLMEFPHECAEQTFSRFYANAIASHIRDENPEMETLFASWEDQEISTRPLESNESLKTILLEESPWVQEALDEKEKQARLGQLFKKGNTRDVQKEMVSKLKELQLKSGGFPWFAGGDENDFVTRHIVAGYGHLKKLDIRTEEDYRLERVIEEAVTYLDTSIVEKAQKRKARLLSGDNVGNSNKRLHAIIDPETQDTIVLDGIDHSDIHFLYARSFYLEEQPLSGTLKAVVNVYLDTLKNDWITRSVYDQALTALVMKRYGFAEIGRNIVESLEQQAVESEANGIYWKQVVAGTSWYEAPVETQALLIETFAEFGASDAWIDGMKLWLLKNKRTHKWSTTKATSEAIYALVMNGTDWLSVRDGMEIKLNSGQIPQAKLKEVTKEAGTGYFQLRWDNEEVDESLAKITINNTSAVSGFGGAYWQYYEEIDKVTSDSEGPLQVEKEIYQKTRSTQGERLQKIDQENTLQVGDLVTVRLVIWAKEDLEFVHLKDLRGSGLEPVDVLSEYRWRNGLGYYQATRDVATHFFFDRLPRGTFIFEYDLRVNNPGNFASGISQIQSMYAPEFSAKSSGGRIAVMKD